MPGSSIRAGVLRAIALDGPISRSRIAQQLDVSAATVTSVTRDLIDAGLVTMSGKAPSSGRRGRPLELLTVVPDAATVLGLKVAADHVTGVATDLRGEVVQRFDGPFEPRSHDPAASLSKLLGGVRDATSGRLIGIGLGVPGTVATDEAGSVTSPMFGWDHLPLGALLSQRLGVPVIVDNDVNTLTMAEHLYGRAREVDDFVVVTVGRGIGAGVFLDGALRRGRGGAGELGHTHAVPDGPPCDCGRRGCLEAVAAEPALVGQASSRGLVVAAEGIGALRALAATSEEAAALFAAAGRHLGRAVADTVNLLAPSMVIVSGEGVVGWELLRGGFEEAFSTRVLDVHGDVEVVVEPWEDGSWARGAAALVLGAVFSPAVGVASAGQLHTRLHAAAPREVPA